MALQTSTETVGNISGGGCMRRNCCKQKIENNKKIKFRQKLLEVKESTSVEGPTNCMQPRQPQGSATIMIKIIT